MSLRHSGTRVQVYYSHFCMYCVMAERLLQLKGVAYDKIRIDRNPQTRTEMERRSGRRSVPQIFIGETHVGGFTDLTVLEARGELDTLLAQATAG